MTRVRITEVTRNGWAVEIVPDDHERSDYDFGVTVGDVPEDVAVRWLETQARCAALKAELDRYTSMWDAEEWRQRNPA